MNNIISISVLVAEPDTEYSNWRTFSVGNAGVASISASRGLATINYNDGSSISLSGMPMHYSAGKAHSPYDGY